MSRTQRVLALLRERNGGWVSALEILRTIPATSLPAMIQGCRKVLPADAAIENRMTWQRAKCFSEYRLVRGVSPPGTRPASGGAAQPEAGAKKEPQCGRTDDLPGSWHTAPQPATHNPPR